MNRTPLYLPKLKLTMKHSLMIKRVNFLILSIPLNLMGITANKFFVKRPHDFPCKVVCSFKKNMTIKQLLLSELFGNFLTCTNFNNLYILKVGKWNKSGFPCNCTCCLLYPGRLSKAKYRIQFQWRGDAFHHLCILHIHFFYLRKLSFFYKLWQV